MPEPNIENLLELGEQLLDNEGQVELSVRIDEGKLKLAQLFLLGVIDAKMTSGKLSKDGLDKIMPKLGLTSREIEQIRRQNADKF